MWQYWAGLSEAGAGKDPLSLVCGVSGNHISTSAQGQIMPTTLLSAPLHFQASLRPYSERRVVQVRKAFFCLSEI